ncbi:MAG TPA: nucleotidyltransferase family protein [Armatimonadota bacterium]
MSTRIERAVILAAGRGIRLMPLTADRPKPMIELAGRPLLERVLRGLQAAGIREALVVLGYLGAVIRACFGDGDRIGLRLYYCDQQEKTGTAGALFPAESFCGSDPFLLHWGDILVDPANYPPLLERFAQREPTCLLGVNWVADPCKGGAVYRDGERILEIVEKAPAGSATTLWNNGGIVGFSHRLWPYLQRTPPSHTGEYYLTDTINLLAGAGERVLAYEINGDRVHITSPEDVAALQGDPRILRWEQTLAALSKAA